MSGEKYKFGLPLAAILAISSACGGGQEAQPKSLTDCDSSGTGFASTVLREGEIIELEGIPVVAKSGKIRIPMETIGVENVRLVARHKFRVYVNGRVADVSMPGGKILIETDNNKRITASGEPIPRVGPLHTELLVDVECKK